MHMRAPRTYDSRTVLLHWVTAGLVTSLWVLGQTGDLLPRGSVRTGVWSVHVLLGFVLAVLIAYRLIRRARGISAPARESTLERLGAAMHVVLYALIIATVALGIWNALLRGQSLFDLVRLPQVPSERAFRRSVDAWHEWSANLLLMLALLHAAAGLAHHYILRDGVLRRMLPGLR